MNYLIVAATVLEVKPLLDQWDLESPNVGEVTLYHSDQHKVTILISGIGMMSTAYHLGSILQKEKYDLVINAGIAGSFDAQIGIGSLVVVGQQQYADLGASSSNGYEDFFDLGFLDMNELPFENGVILCPHTAIMKEYALLEVQAISVNKVTGDQHQLKRIKNKYNPQIEVMEGIAIHYACRLEEVTYVEVRAISNFVEVRNKSNWKIKEAIETLNDFLIEWFSN